TPVLLGTRREICFWQHRLLARGAGGVELVNSVRPFRLAASRSPSPWPSPSGGGDAASRAAASRDALDWRKRGGRFSLSRWAVGTENRPPPSNASSRFCCPSRGFSNKGGRVRREGGRRRACGVRPARPLQGGVRETAR